MDRVATAREGRSRAGSQALRLLALAAVIVVGAAIASVITRDSVPPADPSFSKQGGTRDVQPSAALASVSGAGGRTLAASGPVLRSGESEAEDPALIEEAATPESLDPFDPAVSIVMDSGYQAMWFTRRLHPGDVVGRSTKEGRASAWEDPAVRDAYARLQERYVLRDHGWNFYGHECQRRFDALKPQPTFDQAVSPAIRDWVRLHGTSDLRQRIAYMEEWVRDQLLLRGHTGRVSTGLSPLDDTENSPDVEGPGYLIHEWALRGLPYFQEAQDVIYVALGLKVP